MKKVILILTLFFFSCNTEEEINTQTNCDCSLIVENISTPIIINNVEYIDIVYTVEENCTGILVTDSVRVINRVGNSTHGYNHGGYPPSRYKVGKYICK